MSRKMPKAAKARHTFTPKAGSLSYGPPARVWYTPQDVLMSFGTPRLKHRA